MWHVACGMWVRAGHADLRTCDLTKPTSLSGSPSAERCSPPPLPPLPLSPTQRNHVYLFLHQHLKKARQALQARARKQGRSGDPRPRMLNITSTNTTSDDETGRRDTRPPVHPVSRMRNRT